MRVLPLQHAKDQLRRHREKIVDKHHRATRAEVQYG